MLTTIEEARIGVSKRTDAAKKSRLGQYLTPASTAEFMAGLFVPGNHTKARLLDAGAGIGSLSTAFIQRFHYLKLDSLWIEAFETDETLHTELAGMLSIATAPFGASFAVTGGDFVEEAVNRIQFGSAAGYEGGFTHAILNPPYKKISGDSRHRALLRAAGIETVNLYSAFVALALQMMVPAGQLVAIIPRSFCNGPYYRRFREFILDRAALRRIHLFDSRHSAFKDDGVLQENVVVLLERGGVQGDVAVSVSTDDSFADLVLADHPVDRIVLPGDPERFIHVPTSPGRSAMEDSLAVRCALSDIGIQVSTGPVVDFRLSGHLRAQPEPGSVPLLYPGHFTQQGLDWPKAEFKKSNALVLDDVSRKWLYANGCYCVVRRFSSKEEKRRIVANVVEAENFPGVDWLGFENHLNVFHEGKKGLPRLLAHGLAVFLNSSAIDEAFRRFNGHTQVNATDLKLMKYPSRSALGQLGQWAVALPTAPHQAQIDERIAALMQ